MQSFFFQSPSSLSPSPLTHTPLTPASTLLCLTSLPLPSLAPLLLQDQGSQRPQVYRELAGQKRFSKRLSDSVDSLPPSQLQEPLPPPFYASFYHHTTLHFLPIRQLHLSVAIICLC